MDEYESVSLVKPEVFVFRIPPLGSNKGHKAAEWNLDKPDWTGRLKLVSIGGDKLEIRLEDKTTGALYAKCPIDAYPGGLAIEPVTDSSRYFVIRLKNDSGQSAFVGCGFSDRGDSFDLNVALQDHFKHLSRACSSGGAVEPEKPLPDLAFREGQTISIKIGKMDGAAVKRPKATTGTSTNVVPLLPPPPGPNSSVSNRSRFPPPNAPASSSNSNNLLDF
ncbi:unnamed protein product [Caenorhabditis auriculariae]|uniref:NECAP PHear domain-containing protein n=1 Tax=Caenorhabditis auriculariae TaxID=2777116 RepID=A0A8S1H9I0_9PELO|nr:unnamed protein product [Caenorhabditis auriculariae]